MSEPGPIILQAIQMLMSGETQRIQEAEDAIAGLKGHQHFANHLFVIGEDFAQKRQVRVAALSILVRELEAAYGRPAFPYDLTYVKDKMLGLIEATHGDPLLKPKVTDLLEILVLKENFVTWAGMLDKVISYFRDSSSPQQTLAALQIVRPVFRAYQHAIEAERKPLHVLLQQFLPFFERSLLENVDKTDPVSLEILHAIFKILNWSIMMQLDPEAVGPQNLKTWMVAANVLLGKPVGLPPPNGPLDWSYMVGLEKHIHFKAKKSALAVLSRLARHASSEKSDPAIIDLVVQNNLPVLETVLLQINTHYDFIGLRGTPAGAAASLSLCTRGLFEALNFVNYSLQIQITFPYMNGPMVEAIVYEIVIYGLQVTQFEVELYSANVTQYIYSSKNIANDPVMLGKKLSADLVTLLAKYDSSFARKFVTYLMQVTEHGVDPRSKAPATDTFVEGLYYGLEEILELTNQCLQGGIPEIIKTLILPVVAGDTKSDFLKARAMSILTGLHAVIEDETTLSALLQGVCGELTVQRSLFTAATAIQTLSVLLENERAPEMLKANIPDILQHTLELLKQINLDEIVVSLQSVVVSFGDEIRPYAKDILNNILESFWVTIKANEDLQRDDFEENCEKTEVVDALESCVKSMTEILRLSFEPGFYEECKPWVLDIFNFMFGCRNLRQMFGEVLRLFNALLTRLPAISDDVLFYFPVLCYAYSGLPQDRGPPNVASFGESQQRLLVLDFAALNLKIDSNISLNGLVTIYGNYIQKARDIFFGARDFFGTPFIDLVFGIVFDLASIGVKESDNINLILSLKLLSFLFENCAAQVKTHVHTYQEILRYLSQYVQLSDRGRHFQCLVLSKLCLLIYLDADFFLTMAKAMDLLQPLLYGLCGSTAEFVDEDEKRMLLLGITGLFSVPLARIPDIPVDFMTATVHSVVTFLVQEESREKRSTKADDLFVENNMVEEDDDDDDSWHEEDAQEEDDFDYNDLLETREPVLELMKVWQSIQKERPADFQAILNSMPSEAQKDVFNAFAFFENKENAQH